MGATDSANFLIDSNAQLGEVSGAEAATGDVADIDASPDSEIEQMRQLLVASKTLPVLFVGSGISRRYIDSPDWEGLLEHFAGKTGRPLSYYTGKANGDLPGAASLIAEEFYQVWWDEAEFETSREDLKETLRSKSDPLKIEVAKFVDALEYTEVDRKV